MHSPPSSLRNAEAVEGVGDLDATAIGIFECLHASMICLD